MAQYSALPCVFGIWQNSEKLLISNGLRFVVTCLLMVALWVLFHVARHSFAMALKEQNVPIEMISELLGHKSIKTTQIYLRSFSLEKMTVVNKSCFENVYNYMPEVG